MSIEVKDIHFRYGRVVALDGVTASLGAGAVGLLGPNGAGKSTLLRILLGFLVPERGEGKVLDFDIRRDRAMIRRSVGYMPESDCFIPGMDAVTFTAYFGELSGMPRREAMKRAHEVLFYVGLEEARYRLLDTYSAGMKQRLKLAQALVHEPRVLFLDEPFTGTDPLARRELIDTIRSLAGTGRSVLVSSHVLHEVEALTPNVILLHRGRLVAEGQVRQIRDLIDAHPHRIVLVCDNYRELAARLVRWEDVERLTLLRREGAVLVETRRPDEFYARLPALALDGQTALSEVYSDDDNLEAVFKYLVCK